MKDEKNEFLGLLCNLYIVILLVALPLYTGGGYWQLGDVKYTLFRSLSLLCLGGWLIAGMPGRVHAAIKAVQAWRRCGKAQGKAAGSSRAGRGLARLFGGAVSGMDCAMLFYGICVVLSAACSAYGRLAWTGYEGWYMGAVSQLLFIGIYFFVSRQYGGAAWPLYLGEAAFFLVTLLGLLHRLGIDPLGLMAGWNSGDWEYSHMLSTLGNINWLCGYYSVALAFVLAHFFQARARWLQALLYLVSVAAFVLLFVQGSQGGLLILAACGAACFLLGRGYHSIWKKFALILAGAFAAMPLMGIMMGLRGEKAAVVADGNIFDGGSWYGWLVAAFVCLFLFFLLNEGGRAANTDSGLEKEEEAFPQKGVVPEGAGSREARCRMERTGFGANIKLPVLCVLCIVGIAGMLAMSWFWRHMDDSFGSGRGFLWRISVEGFLQADGKDKLLGAGPDCYGEAVFGKLGAETEVWKGEHWEGAVFTNAHCELLSQLCNVGILGTAGYLAIFAVGLCRYGGFHAKAGRSSLAFCEGGIGVLALAMYGIHSLVSFQQVLNAPLLFLALGLCEAEKRRNRLDIAVENIVTTVKNRNLNS